MTKKAVGTQLGARLERAMVQRGLTEAELIAKMHQALQGDNHEDLRKKVSQQMVNNIRKGKSERSYYVPLIAAALDVPAQWLAFGIGYDPFIVQMAPPHAGAQTDRERELLDTFRRADETVKRVIEKALTRDDDVPAKKKAEQRMVETMFIGDNEATTVLAGTHVLRRHRARKQGR